VITEPSLSNGRSLWHHYSGFEEVFTEALPNNGHIPSQYYQTPHFSLIE
jgi:hypothetical protein